MKIRWSSLSGPGSADAAAACGDPVVSASPEAGVHPAAIAVTATITLATAKIVPACAAWRRSVSRRTAPKDGVVVRYDARHEPPLRRLRDRAEVAARLGGGGPLPGLRRPRRRAAAVLRARHVPLPVGRPAHGPRRGVQRRRRRRAVPGDAGHNVLHPIGWDAFGLPAENAAIKRGIAPAGWTYANIEQQAASFKRMGMSFDWSRRLRHVRPRVLPVDAVAVPAAASSGAWPTGRTAPVNWCPKDQTVLANEQVIQGACERCGTLVERRDLTQWFFKITDYAQRLLDDMDDADDWPERVAHDAAQLDRALRGRRGHVHDRGDRRRGRRSSPRGPTRCGA